MKNQICKVTLKSIEKINYYAYGNELVIRCSLSFSNPSEEFFENLWSLYQNLDFHKVNAELVIQFPDSLTLKNPKNSRKS